MSRLTLTRDALAIVLTGITLGVAFNHLERSSRPPRGLPWLATARALDRVDVLVSDAPAPPTPVAPAPALRRADSPPGRTSAGRGPGPAGPPAAAEAETDADPAGVAAPVGRPDAGLPVIPDVGRPLKVGLPTVAKLVEARAALVVDAREPGEFAEGHIPGAVNLPYDQVVRDPAPLEKLEAGGRPIIVYCSGGDCEASRMLAEMMVRDYELRRVLVYEEGFPDWVAAGRRVEGP